jgi:putative methionine-R-sulfoxide reductase with GAF domain
MSGAGDKKKVDLTEVLDDLSALFSGENDWCANSANAAAVVYNAYRDAGCDAVNWCGVYRKVYVFNTFFFSFF